MKTRRSRTILAAAAGLVLVGSVAACSVIGGGRLATVEVGACANIADYTGAEITEIPTVDCSEAHDAQFIGNFDLDDGDYPGEDAIVAAATEGCVPLFEDFVGISFQETALEVQYLRPTQSSWEQADDRQINCIAYYPDGTTTTESFEGAAI